MLEQGLDKVPFLRYKLNLRSMKKEYLLILAVGMVILAYVLDAVVNPLTLRLSTPYHYFTPETVSQYPFTTVSIVLKALAVFIVPVITLASLDLKKMAKSAILLVISGLLQLYALQDIATRAFVVPLEWSLGFTLAGVTLLIPTLLYFLTGLFEKPKSSTIITSPEST